MGNFKFVALLTAGVAIASAFAVCAIAENSSVTKTRQLLESKQQVTIVCLGDSVTGIYYHSGGRRAYPELLESALRSAFQNEDIRVVNAGVSGNRSADGLARLDHDVLSHKPDLVTVMFGLNDVQGVPPQQYVENLRAIVARTRAAGSEVVLGTPNDIIDSPSLRRGELLKYIEAARRLSNEDSLPLADVFTAFESLRTANEADFQSELNDPIHPNFNGHQRIAAVLAGEIAGQSIPISDPAPPQLTYTAARLNARQPIRVVTLLAPQILDKPTMRKLWPEAVIEFLSSDNPESIEEFEAAAEKVRGLNPDLVIVGAPSFAQPTPESECVAGYNRAINQCLSGGEQDWDVIVALPSVIDPSNDSGRREQDRLGRAIARRRDVPCIERRSDDQRTATEIITASLHEQTANLLSPSP